MNNRKGIFFTSDLHLGHLNSIKFDQRPFQDLNHMHRVIVNNWNACVQSDDVVYVLGDVGLCKQEIIPKIISQLNGTKVLILGNHDRNIYSMYEAGFDVVLNAAVFYLGTKRVSMSHCPLPGIFREDTTGMKHSYKDGDEEFQENWHGERKNTMYTSQDTTVDYHLHGHIHFGPANEKEKTTNRQFDVGQPGNGYRPVSISVIESWIALEEQKKTGLRNLPLTDFCK